MDINLTGEFWGMPVSFLGQMTQESSANITDWLPSIVSIVVVIMGGLITYHITTRIEEQKRQYELKKEVYFHTLDLVDKITQMQLDLIPSSIEKLEDESEKSKKQYVELMLLLASTQIRLNICANDEVNQTFEELRKAIPIATVEDATNLRAINDRLIAAMREDLVKERKPWWQF